MSTRLSVSVSEDFLYEALVGDEGLDVLRWDLEGPAPREAIDLVVPDYLAPKSRLANLVGVRSRLVQSQMIGYDGVAALLPPGVVYANAASVHETSTAEPVSDLTAMPEQDLRMLTRTAASFWASSFLVMRS